MKITRYFLPSNRLTLNMVLNSLFGLTFLISFNLLAENIALNQSEQMAIESDPAQQIYQSQQAALIAQGYVDEK